MTFKVLPICGVLALACLAACSPAPAPEMAPTRAALDKVVRLDAQLPDVTALADIAALCAAPQSRFLPEQDDPILLDIHTRTEAREGFGAAVEVLHLRVGSWNAESGSVVRYTVVPQGAGLVAGEGEILVHGNYAAIQGYAWVVDAAGEVTYAGLPPNDLPVRVPCMDAPAAVAALDEALDFLPLAEAQVLTRAEAVEKEYVSYLAGIDRDRDVRLDRLLAACRFEDGHPGGEELVSAGYQDREGRAYPGTVFFTGVSHYEDGKGITTLFIPRGTLWMQHEDRVLTVKSHEANIAGFSAEISPIGEYSSVSDFEEEAVDMSFACRDPFLAEQIVYGVTEWAGAGLTQAPVIRYTLNYARAEESPCTDDPQGAAKFVERSFLRSGLDPQAVEEGGAADVTFTLSPAYADAMLPQGCHYAVEAAPTWSLNDPGLLVLSFGADPVETSYRDLEVLTDRLGRSFLAYRTSGE